MNDAFVERPPMQEMSQASSKSLTTETQLIVRDLLAFHRAWDKDRLANVGDAVLVA